MNIFQLFSRGPSWTSALTRRDFRGGRSAAACRRRSKVQKPSRKGRKYNKISNKYPCPHSRVGFETKPRGNSISWSHWGLKSLKISVILEFNARNDMKRIGKSVVLSSPNSEFVGKYIKNENGIRIQVYENYNVKKNPNDWSQIDFCGDLARDLERAQNISTSKASQVKLKIAGEKYRKMVK